MNAVCRLLPLLLVATLFSLSGCGLQAARRGLLEAESAIQDVSAEPMHDQAAYHLSAARGLLDAARSEYEEADFYQAERFALQAREQAELARAVTDLRSRGTDR
jgi:hypothetical protein